MRAVRQVPDLLVTMLVLVGVAVLIAGCETQERIEEEISSKAPEVRVSAVDLYRDYEANEVAADNRYKGRIVEVSGIVDSIGKDILDQIYITLEVGQSSFTSVQCFFSDAHKDRAARLTKGEHVRIKGKCDGKFMNISLKGCIFQ